MADMIGVGGVMFVINDVDSFDLDVGLDLSCFDGDLSFDCRGVGGDGIASAGNSETSGSPEWGPRRFRIDEKCSQS